MVNSSGRPYRIVFNNDGNTLFRPFAPWTDRPFSVEGFVEETIGYLKDTQVDVLSWTLGTDIGRMPDHQGGPGRATNMYCHETEVGERFYAQEPPFLAKSWYLLGRRVREMIEGGDDPPRVLAEAAHRSGLKMFCAFRMNDAHDGRFVERHERLYGTKIPLRFPVFEGGRFLEENIQGYICRLKREHPELLIGEQEGLTRIGSIAFDYAHEAVRAFRLALIEEACEKYDVDGVELDFLRIPLYFKPGEEDAHMGRMTEFVGKVRAVLDRVGESRGKQMALAVRTLAPLEASRGVGLDVQAWLEEGWVDVLIGGIVDRSQLDLEGFVQAAHRHNCAAYASLKTDVLLGRECCKPEVFRAVAANHYRAGVDGVYLFNMTSFRYRWGKERRPPPGLGLEYDFQPLREIGSFEDIRFQDKHYILDNRGAGHKTGVGTFDEWSEEMQDRLLRSEVGTAMLKPDLPARLEAGVDATVRFRIADDLQEAGEAGLGWEARLRVSLSDLTHGAQVVEVCLNEGSVSKQRLSESGTYCLEVPVDSALLRCGENVLTLSLEPQDRNVISKLRLDDVEIFVAYEGLRG